MEPVRELGQRFDLLKRCDAANSFVLLLFAALHVLWFFVIQMDKLAVSSLPEQLTVSLVFESFTRT